MRVGCDTGYGLFASCWSHPLILRRLSTTWCVRANFLHQTTGLPLRSTLLLASHLKGCGGQGENNLSTDLWQIDSFGAQWYISPFTVPFRKQWMSQKFKGVKEVRGFEGVKGDAYSLKTFYLYWLLSCHENSVKLCSLADLQTNVYRQTDGRTEKHLRFLSSYRSWKRLHVIYSSYTYLRHKVIYSSRTHSQLSQAVAELSRTSYRFDFSLIFLLQYVILGIWRLLFLDPETNYVSTLPSWRQRYWLLCFYFRSL